MKRHFSIFMMLLLALAMLFAGVRTAYAETGGEEQEPTDVTPQCAYESSQKSMYLRSRLGNLNENEKHAIEAGQWISIRWTDADVDYVCYSWTDMMVEGSMELLEDHVRQRRG